MSAGAWNPGKLLKVSGSYWEAIALHTGVSMGVFDLLGGNPLTPRAVAGKTGSDERGVGLLLDALAAMELLEKSGDRFTNTRAADEFLVNGSPSYIGDMIKHHSHLVAPWSRLADAVKTGGPVREETWSEEALESFLMGMENQARRTAAAVMDTIELDGRRRLLDLGGGPGTFAINFCLANEGMKASVFDLPSTRPFAVRSIKKAGLENRVSFMAGDCLTDDIGGPYDAVWLSHLIHGMGPEESRVVIGKAASALEPGGLIAVHDFFLNDTFDGPLFPALFSLNMLVNTEKGRSYSEKEVREMLAEAGVRDIERPDLQSPSGSGILCGLAR